MDLYDVCVTFWFEILCCTIPTHLSNLEDKATDTIEALPGVLGIQGEVLFIFRDLGKRVIYFQEFGEKA